MFVTTNSTQPFIANKRLFDKKYQNLLSHKRNLIYFFYRSCTYLDLHAPISLSASFCSHTCSGPCSCGCWNRTVIQRQLQLGPFAPSQWDVLLARRMLMMRRFFLRIQRRNLRFLVLYSYVVRLQQPSRFREKRSEQCLGLTT